MIVKKLETDKEREISDLKRELKSLRDTKEKDEEFLKNEIEAVRKNLMSQLVSRTWMMQFLMVHF